METVLDPETGLPLRHEAVINEGSRHKSHLTLFDHENGTATFHDRIGNTTNTVSIDGRTLDLLTFMYSARELDLASIGAMRHRLFVDGKVYPLEIRIMDVDRVGIPPYGDVESIMMEPVAEFDGLFLRQGRIFFWVSEKKRRMVTRIRAEIPVGSINIKLQEVAGPGNDFWIVGPRKSASQNQQNKQRTAIQ
jgi:hypothetical protein